jgi:GR25 family glycosyltransferase involved in LPS biosynthesis
MNEKLNNIFEKVYVINIDGDSERMQRTRRELEGVRFERFPAITSFDSAATGGGRLYVKNVELCITLSHLAIIKEARHQSLNNVVIFEDDILFDNDFAIYDLDLIKRFIGTNDWAMFYLGGAHVKEPNLVDVGISKVTRTLTTHAYAVNGKYFDILIDQIERNKLRMPLDICYAYFIQTRFPCYCCCPRLYLQDSAADYIPYYKDVVSNNLVQLKLFPLTLENTEWYRWLPKYFVGNTHGNMPRVLEDWP